MNSHVASYMELQVQAFLWKINHRGTETQSIKNKSLLIQQYKGDDELLLHML